MINIAIYNNSAHSVLHYRTFGPLSKLRRVWNEISLVPITPNQTEMSVLYNCDILLINRPATKKEYDIILNAKSAGCKIWVDIDDYIQEISIYNPAYGTYQPDNIEYYLECLNEADLITVSTHKLNELTPNSIVVPNGIEPIFKEPVMKRDKLTLAWRGTNTHRMDLHLYQDVFKEFARHPNFDVVFYGYLPLWTNDIEVKYRSFTSLPNFFKYWNNDPIDFVFFPLEDNVFNTCKCLTKDTMLITDSGIKTIDNLKVTDKVYQRNTFEEVSNIVKYTNQNIIELETEDGFTIRCTHNHKLSSNSTFIEANALSIGDNLDISFFEYPDLPYVSIPLNCIKQQSRAKKEVPTDSSISPRITINEEWGLFLGIIIGDGTINSYNRVGICMADHHVDMANYVYSFAERLGLNVTPVKKTKGQHGIDLYINSVILREFLAIDLGISKDGQKVLEIPDCIYNSPKSVVASFLKGLFDTDGTVADSGVNVCTKSLKLAQQVQFLLLGFNIKSKLVKRHNKVYNRYYYYIVLGRQACDIYHREIGFLNKDKAAKLEIICNKEHSNAYKEWDLTTKISNIKYGTEDVYDIEVPNNNYYVANGIVSHNSNISWLESTQIGATFYTNLRSPEYSHKGIEINPLQLLEMSIEDCLEIKLFNWDVSKQVAYMEFNTNEINKFRKHLIQELV